MTSKELSKRVNDRIISFFQEQIRTLLPCDYRQCLFCNWTRLDRQPTKSFQKQKILGSRSDSPSSGISESYNQMRRRLVHIPPLCVAKSFASRSAMMKNIQLPGSSSGSLLSCVKSAFAVMARTYAHFLYTVSLIFLQYFVPAQNMGIIGNLFL
ncbi:hypothetical protein DFH09DRAFT_1156789 [Mycena vulgaris]|nr:hypothetical protein DFH09DRAFT_1156789 [Mycena vulgaris]